MNAVITAGGRVYDEFAREAGTPVKALARIRGAALIDRAIGAARGAGARRVAVIGGSDVRAHCAARVDAMIDEGDSGAENVHRALRAWSDDVPLLYLTSDLPYIEAAHLGDFVERAGRDALAMPICDVAAYETRFARRPGLNVRLAGERVVNGCAFIIPTGSIDRIAALGAHFFDARKDPLAMARLVGFPFLIRFVLGRLSIARLERRATEVLGIPARAVRESAPELAYDIDTVDDYRHASAHA